MFSCQNESQDKNYVCDYIGMIKNMIISLDEEEQITAYLENIQHMVQNMENVLIDRKDKLLQEGYVVCPSCRSVIKPMLYSGLYYYNCCGFSY